MLTLLINNFITVCFCALRKYIFHMGCNLELNEQLGAVYALIVGRRLSLFGNQNEATNITYDSANQSGIAKLQWFFPDFLARSWL